MDSPEPDLREQLRLVEEELAGLRQTVHTLRSQVGKRSEGATDPAEAAAVITSAEEQEALIGALTVRRDRLLRLLGGP